jgi:hypothetical protein
MFLIKAVIFNTPLPHSTVISCTMMFLRELTNYALVLLQNMGWIEAKESEIKFSRPPSNMTFHSLRFRKIGRTGKHSSILGAFAKLRKATISFAISIRLSVRPRWTTRLTLDGFS